MINSELIRNAANEHFQQLPAFRRIFGGKKLATKIHKDFIKKADLADHVDLNMLHTIYEHESQRHLVLPDLAIPVMNKVRTIIDPNESLKHTENIILSPLQEFQSKVREISVVEEAYAVAALVHAMAREHAINQDIDPLLLQRRLASLTLELEKIPQGKAIAAHQLAAELKTDYVVTIEKYKSNVPAWNEQTLEYRAAKKKQEKDKQISVENSNHLYPALLIEIAAGVIVPLVPLVLALIEIPAMYSGWTPFAAFFTGRHIIVTSGEKRVRSASRIKARKHELEALNMLAKQDSPFNYDQLASILAYAQLDHNQNLNTKR